MAPLDPVNPAPDTPWHDLATWTKSLLKPSIPQLNFYRVHLIYFVTSVLVSSAVYYGATDAERPIAYIDCLLVSTSAITGAGLSPTNLSYINVYQQTILFILMILGSTVWVSIVVLGIRRYFFSMEFAHIEKRVNKHRAKSHSHTVDEESGSWSALRSLWRSRKKIAPHMIRRVDEPVKVNQMSNDGHVSEKMGANVNGEKHEVLNGGSSEGSDSSKEHEIHPAEINHAQAVSRSSVDFELPHLRMRKEATRDSRRRTVGSPGTTTPGYPPVGRSLTFERNNSIRSRTLDPRMDPRPRHDPYLGGFPWPHQLVIRFLKRRVPVFNRALSFQRTMTNRSMTGYQDMPYLSFTPTVGRNSTFVELSSEQKEELGGLEYSALKVLCWLVPAYFIGWLLISITIIAPWAVYDKTISGILQQQVASPPGAWFAVFQMMSTFTNTGLMLVDNNMTVFNSAYLLLFVMIFVMLAGGTAFPIFLRLIIWISSKCISSDHHIHAVFQFLLDHPRRCFIYLFPSDQTWWLVGVLAVLNMVDWISFGVLDLGNAVVDAIPFSLRVFDGLFQAFSVRMGGFYIVNLALVAPSLQVTYLIMQYISAIPTIISVRSTNVYEERSLGIYPGDERAQYGWTRRQSFDEHGNPTGDETILNSNNYAEHVRRQLAHDIWSLFFALWLICIIEKNSIIDTNLPTFTVFSIMFEIVSAYGCVGLSFGVPNDTVSFCGSWHLLSKLVLVVVMIRGRHRGLPVAIDRAVLLPGQTKYMDLPMDDESAVNLGPGGGVDPSAFGNINWQTNGLTEEPQSMTERRGSEEPPRRASATSQSHLRRPSKTDATHLRHESTLARGEPIPDDESRHIEWEQEW